MYNIRSAHNVGSMFRTADAAGVSKIYIVGYTPAPVDRFGRQRADIAKVALGAEKSVSWEHVDDGNGLLSRLKNAGISIVALEQSPKSIDYRKVLLSISTGKKIAGMQGSSIALVVGPEVGGLGDDILEACDTIAEIPMYGTKESLNVSVAAGIMLFALRDKL